MIGRRSLAPAQIIALTVFMAAVGCIQDAPRHPAVTIVTEPEDGAQVIIAEVLMGETPLTIDGLKPGPMGVELIKEGYKPANELLTVPPMGSEDLTVVIELRPLVGFVSFESEPIGAKVYLNGTKYIGETPLARVPVAVGEHEVEMIKPSYEPLRASLVVEADYVYEQRHQLTPMRSSLSVLTVPTGATIWVNEALQEQKTPARIELPPGRHSVSVHAKGFISKDAIVDIGPAEQEVVEIRLVPGDVPPNMVLIPAGEFLMGSEQSPHERPPRKLFVDTFYIDRFEVTNQDFKVVFPAHAIKEGQELNPVRGVTWNQAHEYAQAVGKRLPTEAEWEKAARSDDGRIYPWGNEFKAEWCSSAETFGAVLRKVGYFREGQSPYGVMDMAGNVYEWTSEWYRAYPGNTEISKDYGQVFRVLRGGSFKTHRFDVRCAARHYDKQDSAREDYGFRCAKDAE